MTRRNSKATAALTDLQQAILDVLWDRGPSTAEQIRHALAPRFALKDSTVRTLLRRLETRALVQHEVEGKVFVYRAEHGARSLAARAAQHVIDRFCQGSAEQFLLGMVDEKVLSVGDLGRLVETLKRRKNKKEGEA